MALQIEKELENGIVADYWKIERYELDIASNNLIVSLGHYLSKEVRDAEKDPVGIKVLHLTYDTKDVLMETVYNKIKDLPEFSGSIDC